MNVQEKGEAGMSRRGSLDSCKGRTCQLPADEDVNVRVDLEGSQSGPKMSGTEARQECYDMGKEGDD